MARKAKKTKKNVKAKKVALRTKKNAKPIPGNKAGVAKAKKKAASESEIDPIEGREYDLGYLIP